MFQEKTFHTDVLAINFAEGPQFGTPLILLHGGGDRWQNFMPILPNLATKWHIYALDLRGHGKSGRVPNQYRPNDYVPDVISFLINLLNAPAILFGHSLGGWIALMVAAQLKKEVKALILGEPPLNTESFVTNESSEQRISMWRSLRELIGANLPVAEMASRLADFPVSISEQDESIKFGDLPGMDEAHFRNWAEMLNQIDPDVIRYHAEGRLHKYVEKVDVDTALQAVSCPVLLLQGDPSRGGVISDSDAEHALSLLSNGTHVKLEGLGHDLGLETNNPGPILDAVVDFLESR
jgi:pimeloyl-ACP methyl ester carboxylesterase